MNENETKPIKKHDCTKARECRARVRGNIMNHVDFRKKTDGIKMKILAEYMNRNPNTLRQYRNYTENPRIPDAIALEILQLEKTGVLEHLRKKSKERTTSIQKRKELRNQEIQERKKEYEKRRNFKENKIKLRAFVQNQMDENEVEIILKFHADYMNEKHR